MNQNYFLDTDNLNDITPLEAVSHSSLPSFLVVFPGESFFRRVISIFLSIPAFSNSNSPIQKINELSD
jgi:hypothetical protein